MLTIKEKTNKLVMAYVKDEDVIEMIFDILESMNSYVKTVNSMENTINVLKFRLEADEFKIRVQELDMQRRIIHNSVISGVKLLNKISKTVGLEEFYNGDVLDRYAVADFAGLVSSETFELRKK